MKSTNTLSVAVLILALGFVFSCKKNSDIQSSPVISSPVIATKPVTTINSTSVISGGEFANATTIIDKGIIWGTDSSTLTVSTINKISNGAVLTNFTDTIQILQPNTTYYLKAYSIYSSGVSYGAAIKFTTPPTVYVAGYHGTSAAYWKDGKLFPLTGGTYAHSIYVMGNDVYVAGENNNGSLQAVYWKNGIRVLLTNGINAALANSIYVVGNDVYVAGYEVNGNWPVAKYWKNGIATSLTKGTIDNNGILYSIKVVGSDIYVAGFTSNGYMGYEIPTYWKNGIAVPLLDSTKATGVAQSIFIDNNNNVYVAGQESSGVGIGFAGVPVAKYWKNGIPVALTNGSQNAYAYSAFITGSDVYAAGFEYSGSTGYSIAKYWKNGISVSLTDGTLYGSAQSMYVVGSDVYVVGSEDNGFNSRKARYWKNGVSLPLEISAQFSTAVSVFVQ